MLPGNSDLLWPSSQSDTNVAHLADMAVGLRIPFHFDSFPKRQSFYVVFRFERYGDVIGVRSRSSYLPKAKILSQIMEDKTVLPIEVLAQAKAKDPPNDSLPKFAELYASYSRVGTLMKESHTGKLIQSWETAISGKNNPELVDISPAVSSFMAVKDEEELVRLVLSEQIPPSDYGLSRRKQYGPRQA
jgi:hypothetical protein